MTFEPPDNPHLEASREQRKLKNRAYKRAHEDPAKVQAWQVVATALKQKRLFRKPCEYRFHGCVKRPVQAHHHKGYAPEHRLDVRWTCFPCHQHLQHLERRDATARALRGEGETLKGCPGVVVLDE